MFKIVFIATAIVVANPGFVLAQDIFWSFSPTELTTAAAFELDILQEGPSGSAYIFSDGRFGFGDIDLNFTTSNSDVLRFTGGEAFNPMVILTGGTRFDSSEILFDAAGSLGNLFAVTLAQNGVNALTPLIDPGFVPGIGSSGAVLLARVDFEIVGAGTADLEFDLGAQGVIQLPDTALSPSFGPASAVITAVPEATPKIGFCIGDVNLSGTEEANFRDGVDFFDIAPFIDILVSRGFQFEADCNSDGVVDFFDIAPFIEILANNGVL